MAGQIKKNPLPELIREISAEGLSGALRLARERAKTVVYFDAGELIYAVSNLRAFRLDQCARRWNMLNEAQLASVQGKTNDLELGSALVEAKILSPEMLDALMARQVTELLYQTLQWSDGDWDFDPRARLASDVRVSVMMKKLLLESARHLPTETISERFKDRAEQISLEAEVPADINLLPNEAFVLSRIDFGLSVNELVAISGLPEAETLHIIYTLALGGFLRREKWPASLSEAEKAKGRMVRTVPVREATPVTANAKVEEKPETETASKGATAAPVEQRDEQGELEAFFARLNMATDYYQALGVRRSANVAEIKRAYYALAKRFHPDRFRREVDAERLVQIESAFAQIAQAYETLKDTNGRAVYDTKMLKNDREMRKSTATTMAASNQDRQNSGQEASKARVETPNFAVKSEPEQKPYQIEEIFQQGLKALQRGNNAAAIASLGEAARLAPNESRYRAYFGQAMAKDERLRRSAESEIKAAIALDANNASYRVMLAELYSGIGLLKRAQGELDRALAADPQNEAALRLRDKLKGG